MGGKLARIFGEIMEIDSVFEDMSIENTKEWDSLKHLQLLTAIEKEFNIEIDFRDSINMTSIKAIKETVRKYENRPK